MLNYSKKLSFRIFADDTNFIPVIVFDIIKTVNKYLEN